MNWKTYFRFTKAQANGSLVLMLLIILAIFSNWAIPYFVAPKTEPIDSTIAKAFSEFEQDQIAQNELKNPESKVSEKTLFAFDPNTIDSNGCLALGLRPKTIHLFLNWRRKGKIFRTKDDFKQVYTLTEEEYIQLQPYINIQQQSTTTESFFNKTQRSIPDKISINITDSATLVLLRGIGPTLAHKIIQKRNALGGFHKMEQLSEVYKFPDTTWTMLKEKIIIDGSKINKFNLNTSSLEELSKHPYVGEKIAQNIILLRQGLKRFEKLEQLRQVPLMNEEIYRKIAPYFTL